MDTFIHIERVSKTFNAGMPDEMRALSDVSLDVGRGEAVVLNGPSGSGKTTLLSIIGCMTRPTGGRVVVDGRDVAKLPERFLTGIRRTTFGFIFQQFNLIRDLSVLENIMLPLYPVGIDIGEMLERGERLLDRFSLRTKRDMKVRQLSGGEQQRTAIARALINGPEVVIADEPTAHLDRQLSIELVAHLRDLHAEGHTLIIATHDPFMFGQPFISRAIAMQDGRIVEGNSR